MMRAPCAVCLVLAGLHACGGEPSSEPARFEDVALDAGDQWLMSVTAAPGGQTWFMMGGTPEQGALYRGDGVSFEALDPGEVPLLTWAHAFAADDVFIVGDQATVLRFDGQRFERHQVPTEQDLWGVWGASRDDVWAVGGDGRAEGHATLLHFDGETWSEAAQPTLTRPKVWAWYKVWGSSADDVYVVGQNGGVLHFDGERWEERLVGASDDLIAVWGSDADHVMMVGGRDNARVVRFDGEDFEAVSLAPLPGLNGVWMDADNTVHVAGIEGTLAKVDFETLTYEESRQPTRLAFHALHGAGSRLLAVGGNLGASMGPYRAIAMVKELTR